MAGITIGNHDTGIFDLQDPIKTGKKIGENATRNQAAKLAEQHAGAELLVRKTGEEPSAEEMTDFSHHSNDTYDVYELSVGDGKTVGEQDVINNISFVEGIAEKLNGKSATLADDEKLSGTKATSIGSKTWQSIPNYHDIQADGQLKKSTYNLVTLDWEKVPGPAPLPPNP